jgi:hypothetical protein
MLVVVVIGLVLNHPVIQILGGGMALLPFILGVLVAWDDGGGEIMVVVTPLCIVISCGLVSLGHQCSYYRP